MYDGFSAEPSGPSGVAKGAAEKSEGTLGTALECHGVLIGAEGAGGGTEAAGLSYLYDSEEPGRAAALDGLPRGAEGKS
jgi:hypothetical protein